MYMNLICVDLLCSSPLKQNLLSFFSTLESKLTQKIQIIQA